MACKHSSVHGACVIRCDFGCIGTCMYQYWCTKDKCYKSTATPEKCKYYEEAEKSDKK